MRTHLPCLLLVLTLCGCTHSHLGIALATFDDPSLTRLSGVSPDDEALAASDHLLLDFDEIPAMDLAVFRGKGVSEVALWPGSGHSWRLEWKGDSRYLVIVRGEEQVSVKGPAGDVKLPMGGEAAILLQADGAVLRRTGDAASGSWEPACRGEPGQRGSGGGHSHGGAHHHHH